MTGELEQVEALLGSWRTQGQLRQSQCLHLAIYLAAASFMSSADWLVLLQDFLRIDCLILMVCMLCYFLLHICVDT